MSFEEAPQGSTDAHKEDVVLSHIEKPASHEERERAFHEMATIIEEWQREFAFTKKESLEGADHVSMVMFEFAEYMIEKSASHLEHVRTKDNYNEEIAAAKLHEFNLVNADLLKRAAELYTSNPNSMGAIEHAYPWILTVREWAETFIAGTQAAEEHYKLAA